MATGGDRPGPESVLVGGAHAVLTLGDAPYYERMGRAEAAMAAFGVRLGNLTRGFSLAPLVGELRRATAALGAMEAAAVRARAAVASIGRVPGAAPVVARAPSGPPPRPAARPVPVAPPRPVTVPVAHRPVTPPVARVPVAPRAVQPPAPRPLPAVQPPRPGPSIRPFIAPRPRPVVAAPRTVAPPPAPAAPVVPPPARPAPVPPPRPTATPARPSVPPTPTAARVPPGAGVAIRPPAAEDLATRIERAFVEADRELGGGNFVPLAQMRAKLADVSRERFDAALRDLRVRGRMSLASHEGRYESLTPAMRSAAITEAGSSLVYAEGNVEDLGRQPAAAPPPPVAPRAPARPVRAEPAARAASLIARIEARVRKIEVEKRQIIHEPSGAMRTSIEPAGMTRLQAINRSLERASVQERRVPAVLEAAAWRAKRESRMRQQPEATAPTAAAPPPPQPPARRPPAPPLPPPPPLPPAPEPEPRRRPRPRALPAVEPRVPPPPRPPPTVEPRVRPEPRRPPTVAVTARAEAPLGNLAVAATRAASALGAVRAPASPRVVPEPRRPPVAAPVPRTVARPVVPRRDAPPAAVSRPVAVGPDIARPVASLGNLAAAASRAAAALGAVAARAAPRIPAAPRPPAPVGAPPFPAPPLRPPAPAAAAPPVVPPRRPPAPPAQPPPPPEPEPRPRRRPVPRDLPPLETPLRPAPRRLPILEPPARPIPRRLPPVEVVRPRPAPRPLPAVEPRPRPAPAVRPLPVSHPLPAAAIRPAPAEVPQVVRPPARAGVLDAAFAGLARSASRAARALDSVRAPAASAAAGAGRGQPAATSTPAQMVRAGAAAEATIVRATAAALATQRRAAARAEVDLARAADIVTRTAARRPAPARGGMAPPLPPPVPAAALGFRVADFTRGLAARVRQANRAFLAFGSEAADFFSRASLYAGGAHSSLVTSGSRLIGRFRAAGPLLSKAIDRLADAVPAGLDRLVPGGLAPRISRVASALGSRLDSVGVGLERSFLGMAQAVQPAAVWASTRASRAARGVAGAVADVTVAGNRFGTGVASFLRQASQQIARATPALSRVGAGVAVAGRGVAMAAGAAVSVVRAPLPGVSRIPSAAIASLNAANSVLRSVTATAVGAGRTIASALTAPFRRAGAAAANFFSLVRRQVLTLGGLTALAAPVVSIGYVVRESVRMEAQLNRLRRVVGGTKEETDLLSRSFFNMGSTLAGVDLGNILEIANFGARLGVSRREIDLFTRDLAKVSAVVDIPIDELATRVSGLTDVFGRDRTEAINVASALNALDIQSNASARDILDISGRLSGAAATIGLTAQETLALSTALRQARVPIETAGTALSQIIGRLTSTRDMGNFARLTGRTTAAFQDLLRNSPLEAIIAVEEGLGRLDKIQQFRALERLHLDGQRVRLVMLQLSKVLPQLREFVASSNAEYSSLGSILTGFAQQSETAQSLITRAWNNIQLAAVSLGRMALPAIKGLSDGVAGLARDLQAFANGPGAIVLTSWGEVIGDAFRLAGAAFTEWPHVIEYARLAAVEEFEQFGQIIINFGENIWNYVKVIDGNIGSIASNAIDGFNKFFVDLGSSFIRGGARLAAQAANFAAGIGNALIDKFNMVIGDLQDMAKQIADVPIFFDAAKRLGVDAFSKANIRLPQVPTVAVPEPFAPQPAPPGGLMRGVRELPAVGDLFKDLMRNLPDRAPEKAAEVGAIEAGAQAQQARIKEAQTAGMLADGLARLFAQVRRGEAAPGGLLGAILGVPGGRRAAPEPPAALAAMEARESAGGAPGGLPGDAGLEGAAGGLDGAAGGLDGAAGALDRAAGALQGAGGALARGAAAPRAAQAIRFSPAESRIQERVAAARGAIAAVAPLTPLGALMGRRPAPPRVDPGEDLTPRRVEERARLARIAAEGRARLFGDRRPADVGEVRTPNLREDSRGRLARLAVAESGRLFGAGDRPGAARPAIRELVGAVSEGLRGLASRVRGGGAGGIVPPRPIALQPPVRGLVAIPQVFRPNEPLRPPTVLQRLRGVAAAAVERLVPRPDGPPRPRAGGDMAGQMVARARRLQLERVRGQATARRRVSPILARMQAQRGGLLQGMRAQQARQLAGMRQQRTAFLAQFGVRPRQGRTRAELVRQTREAAQARAKERDTGEAVTKRDIEEFKRLGNDILRALGITRYS